MEDLLLENLAENQAFDAALKNGKQIDRLAAAFLQQAIYNPDSAKRHDAIGQLQIKIVNYFDRQVQPAAQKIGRENAVKVLAATGKGDLEDPDFRRRVLIDGQQRSRDRLRIVQALVNDRANTLENRLAAFWLEPGLTPKQKLNRLIELHNQLDQLQRTYNERLAKFHAGEGSRPRKPVLEFMPRFVNDVKADVREQARRTGTEAETTLFVSQGHKVLAWVTVNASEACPDCRARQGIKGDLTFWDQHGRPGAGKTVCGASCFCMLVPEKTVSDNPSLSKKGLEQRIPSGVTTEPPPASQPKKPKAPQPSPVDPVAAGETPEFPTSPAAVKDIRPLGGSTGARLVEDQHGQQFVLKTGSSADHLREEFHAETAYRALGVPVPESRLYDTPQGPVKLTKFIDGTTIDKLASPEKQRAIEQAQQHFAADALLGNWDVAGLGKGDNLILGKDGVVYRIDMGGALRYRAQGTSKGDRWNKYPMELWTLQDTKINPASAELFAGVGHDAKMDQVQTLIGKRESVLAALPHELRSTVRARLEEMQRLVRSNSAMKADAWKESYRERFNRHQLGVRSVIAELLPKELNQRSGVGYVLYDEKGVPFDGLRGDDGVTAKFYRYVEITGGRPTFISNWASQQAANSWNVEPKALKYFLAQQRETPTSRYYWRKAVTSSKKAYQAVSSGREEAYAETFAAQHAYTYELLQNIEFRHNDRAGGFVELIRTESRDVMDKHGLKRGTLGAELKRGVAESTSVFTRVGVHGTEDTVQRVPHHRVIGTYLQGRSGIYGKIGLFMSDHENEFVAMLQGLKVDYTKAPR